MQGIEVFLDLLFMMHLKPLIRKHWSTILMVLVIILLIVPQTGTPIKVALHKLISFSPSALDLEDQTQVTNYNWPLKTLDGEQINFSQSKNKVVVVNFWATWCPPCIAEMPSLQKLYDLQSKKVDFYFVTTEQPARVKAFMDKKGYTFPVYIQTVNAPSQIQTSALPTTYILNKSGNIVVNKTGAANWSSESVNNMLDNLTALQTN